MAGKISFGGVALRLVLGAVLLLAIYYVLTLLKVTTVNTAQNLLLTMVIGVVAIEVLGIVLEKYISIGLHKSEAATLRSLFRALGYVILILFILFELHIDITGLLVSAGFLGIVFGLAAQATLSNFIAGIYLLTTRAFEPGDRVNIHTWQYTMQPQSYPHDKFVPGFVGVIKNIGVLYTELTNDENVPVYVPNNIVAQALVLNYGRALEKVVHIQFDVKTDVPFSRIREIVARELKVVGVKKHRIEIEYLHQGIYVITVQMEVEFKNRAVLRSAVYESLLNYMNSKTYRQDLKSAAAHKHRPHGNN